MKKIPKTIFPENRIIVQQLFPGFPVLIVFTFLILLLEIVRNVDSLIMTLLSLLVPCIIHFILTIVIPQVNGLRRFGIVLSDSLVTLTSTFNPPTLVLADIFRFQSHKAIFNQWSGNGCIKLQNIGIFLDVTEI